MHFLEKLLVLVISLVFVGCSSSQLEISAMDKKLDHDHDNLVHQRQILSKLNPLNFFEIAYAKVFTEGCQKNVYFLFQLESDPKTKVVFANLLKLFCDTKNEFTSAQWQSILKTANSKVKLKKSAYITYVDYVLKYGYEHSKTKKQFLLLPDSVKNFIKGHQGKELEDRYKRNHESEDVVEASENNSKDKDEDLISENITKTTKQAEEENEETPKETIEEQTQLSMDDKFLEGVPITSSSDLLCPVLLTKDKKCRRTLPFNATNNKVGSKVYYRNSPHKGADFNPFPGVASPVYSSTLGKVVNVVKSRAKTGLGTYVTIEVVLNNSFETMKFNSNKKVTVPAFTRLLLTYGHLDPDTLNYKVGDIIEDNKSKPIGKMGYTGYIGGLHLHAVVNDFKGNRYDFSGVLNLHKNFYKMLYDADQNFDQKYYPDTAGNEFNNINPYFEI